jgi:hypothetical protein
MLSMKEARPKWPECFAAMYSLILAAPARIWGLRFVPRDGTTGLVVPLRVIGDTIKARLAKWGQTRLRFSHSPPQ